MFFAISIIIVIGVFLGCTVGANDAANCVGADIGSGELSVAEGILLTCVFGFLGAVLMGSHVMETLGKGIVPLTILPSQTALYISMVGCLGAALWIMISTFFGLPVSTSHSIVGAIGGAGLAVGAPVYFSKLGSIFICWIVTPVGSMILAMVLYPVMSFLIRTLVAERFRAIVVRWLIIITSIYFAFMWGANDVANASGLMAGSGVFSNLVAVIIGASAIVIGVIIWGRKVIETVGFKITHLSALMTITAEIAAAVNVNLYTLFGIPVSTSHAIVGAVIGVGLSQGIKSVDAKMTRDIVFAWAGTPFASGLLSFVIMSLIKLWIL